MSYIDMPIFGNHLMGLCPNDLLSKQQKGITGVLLSFWAGPRMCVGNNFAMYEMIFTVA